MQVELSTVVAVFSGFASFAAATYAGLLKYTVAAREKELERRLNDLEAGQKSSNKAIVELDAKLQVASTKAESDRTDITEMRANMVTKAQFDDMRATQVEILGWLRRSGVPRPGSDYPPKR